jgi:uncharacterized protein (TIGR00299 family) protein
MGAAGDMLAAALLDLFDNKAAVVDELNGLALPHTKICFEEKEESGIVGTHLHVIIDGHEETPDAHHHHHHHHGRHLDEVLAIIEQTNAPRQVKDDAKAVYEIIAAAEAKAHGKPVGEVHFHEVGMRDAIADVLINAYLIRKLDPTRIIASPIHVGNGTVHCAHGVMPVPAPATANILVGVPYYKGNIQTELCTPTGAALLKYYAEEFTDEAQFANVTKIGVGTGTKQLEQANILRAFLIQDEERIAELSCNVDDMSGEEIAFASEKMMQEGALDCFITPIYMKKGRPAYRLTVLCKTEEKERFAALIFKHTTTIGIRQYLPSRYTLARELSENAGVHIKRSDGYGTQVTKIEFEDIKALALEKDISVFEARAILMKKTQP